MQSGFDEATFFGALANSGARVLLIGRRAMITHGIPVLTADYDLWVHFDDVETLNGAMSALDMVPNRQPAEARARGRYVLENDERVDVRVARAATTKQGVVLRFEEAWSRRTQVPYEGSITIAVPSLEDLVTTKAWAMRVKDVVDIQLIEALIRSRRSP